MATTEVVDVTPRAPLRPFPIFGVYEVVVGWADFAAARRAGGWGYFQLPIHASRFRQVRCQQLGFVQGKRQWRMAISVRDVSAANDNEGAWTNREAGVMAFVSKNGVEVLHLIEI